MKNPVLKLPWKLVTDTDPGCRKCSDGGVRGIQIVNADGEVVLECGHDTFLSPEFDLQAVVDAVNDYELKQ